MTILETKLQELKLSQDEQAEVLQIVANMITVAGQKQPNILDADGNVVEKYCGKHNMYHPASYFPKSRAAKDGLYGHCRYAEKRIKFYAKQVKTIKDAAFTKMALGDDVDMKLVTQKIDEAKVASKQFDLEDDMDFGA